MTRAGGRGAGGLDRARTVALTMLAVEIGVLVVTGIALYFVYRPTVGSIGPAGALRTIHRVASLAAIPTALAAGILVALRRRWTAAAIGAGLFAYTLAASFTGYLLPWTNLALWSVRPNADYRGYRSISDSTVRFVLTRHGEVTPRTIIGLLILHALVLTPALVAFVVLGRRRRRTTGMTGTSD